MSENENEDNLKSFGNDFQQKCLTALLVDKQFIERMLDILDPSIFETEAYQWICRETRKYFYEYKTQPSLTVFKVKIDEIKNDEIKEALISSLKQIYAKVNSDDLTFVKNKFLEFCKNQTLKRAIMESVDHLNSGNYERIKSTVDQALKAGMERNVGHVYDEDIETRMTMAARKCVKTGIDLLDNLLDGGLGSGELGVVAGSPGGGKSWVLCKFGAEAMKQGKNVLHVTLELNESYVGLRYDSIFTKIKFQDIRNHSDKVREVLKEIDGKLVIKYYPIKTIPALTIKNHIERIQMLGKKIDIMIVDYADILRPLDSIKNSNSYNDAGSIYEELRAVAGELQIPCWTASQVGRSGAGADVVEAQHIADSYRKIMTADVVISQSRKKEDKENGTARFHIMKNRFGSDGLTFPAKMDTSNGDIQFFEPNSDEGINLQQLMDSSASDGDNEMKKKLFKKFNELNLSKTTSGFDS